MDETDKRASNRRRTVLKARMLFNNRSSVLDCTVRDLSDTGAQLTLADVSALPPDFELEIPSKDVLVQARVMWSRGKNHGVKFVQASD
jgi:hypothetical protein